MIKPTNDFWEVFKATNGALSCAEAVAIANLAAQAPRGIYIELGTHKGKSGMAALYTLKRYEVTGGAVIFILVDPIFEDANIIEEVYLSMQKVNVIDGLITIDFKSTISLDEITKHDNYSYVFVDSGSHQDGLPMQEVKLLEDRMVQNGIIAFHDWDSQFKEVKEASDYLVSTGKYEYIPINWDKINSYVNENNLNDGNISWHHTELENPNFVGALKRL